MQLLINKEKTNDDKCYIKRAMGHLYEARRRCRARKLERTPSSATRCGAHGARGRVERLERQLRQVGAPKVARGLPLPNFRSLPLSLRNSGQCVRCFVSFSVVRFEEASVEIFLKGFHVRFFSDIRRRLAASPFFPQMLVR